MQIGLGILTYQRIIAKSAGYDSWISIILMGIAIHIVVWMMYKMLKIVNGDIVAIHTFILGKKIGKWVSLVFIIYLCLLCVTSIARIRPRSRWR